MNCGNCGSNVNPGDMFCQSCGAGINNSVSNQNTVISDDALIDAYIGKNIQELRKGNFSWCTFFFDVFYAFYRKMWLFGILYLLSYLVLFALIMVLIVILVKQTNEITFIQNYFKYYLIIYGGISLTSLALRLIFSFKFKKSYLKHATKKVEQIKVRNMGKTNEEIKKECSKKGGTSIVGIFLALLLPVMLYLLLAIPYAIQNKNNIDKAQKGAAKDSAYSIIKEVESAQINALHTFMDKKESITLEDVRNEYLGMSSTWDSDNTITSNHYDFTCNVTVNNDNKMLVSCDVFGEKIESELLDLNIGNKGNNQANNNQNNETDKEEDNNDNQVNDDNQNNVGEQTYKEYTKFGEISLKDGSKWIVIKDSSKYDDYVTLFSKEGYMLSYSDPIVPIEDKVFKISEDEYDAILRQLTNTNTIYEVWKLKEVLETKIAASIPAELKKVNGYKIRLITVDEIFSLSDDTWTYDDERDVYEYNGYDLPHYLKSTLTMTHSKRTVGQVTAFYLTQPTYGDKKPYYRLAPGTVGLPNIKPVIYVHKSSLE